MTQKRALVVDDSKSARLALAQLLEKQHIAVDFAESGEEAIEFLKSHSVDVIFMDHTMPGMDGLETMTVIKADPRTAMIPVMMYTAKEGEVYVGQARALGAVEVLPKQVHPGVLFEMLLKLGLVVDRRAGRRRRSTDTRKLAGARKEKEEPTDEIDRALERQALGMSVQALVTRVLQDQHLELRSDLLASNRDFAKRVADEIWEKQAAEREAALPPPAASGSGRGMAAAVALLLLLPAAVLLLLWSQAAGERDELRAENQRLAQAVEQRHLEDESAQANLLSNLDEERYEADSRYLALVDALQWAVNEGNHFGVDEVAFNEVRLQRLQGLLSRLAAIGFTGTVRLDAYLGEFCLASDSDGVYRLADPELPIMDCALIGHPLGDSASLAERQSVSFANFLASSPLVNNSGIEVQVVAHGRRESVRRVQFPSSLRTAGEWNRIAELNNRVEVTLIPAALLSTS
jgi:CheY-like chemotaxis protein